MRILNDPADRAVRFLGRNGSCVQAPLLFQLLLFDQALGRAGGERRELWLTSGCEGTHSKGSMHPWGWAVDFDLVPAPKTTAEWNRLLDVCRTVMGVEFQLFYEPGPREHAHLELDPGWSG